MVNAIRPNYRALLPDGFALSEWLVLAEAAVQSPIDKRRILGRLLPRTINAATWD